jgi:hypothetical protein
MKEESCSINKKSCQTVNNDGSINLAEHWCAAYTNVDITKSGWYETESKPMLELIAKTGIAENASVLTLGAGATTLIDSLTDLNYTNLIVNDISSCALGNIKTRIGEKAKDIQFITDDIIQPTELNKIEKVDCWIDRAVLHFFTTTKDQQAYFKLLNDKVKSGGFVLLAEFNLQGAKKCSGLDVKRYDAHMLQEALGADYQLKESFDYKYTMPSGRDRMYVYTLFQRK